MNPVLKNIKFIVLEGSPYNRGLIHGKTLKKEIRELINLWKENLQNKYGMNADEFISKFIKETDFFNAIKRWTPELLEEVRGISDGSGIDFETIFVFQLPDEVLVNGKDIAVKHCTSIGVDKNDKNPTYVAQNMDVPTFYHGYQTLLHIKYDNSDLESFVFTFAGMIGLNGLNNRAVAITCNTLAQLKCTKDGLPVAFIVRGVLKQKSLEEAIKFIRSIKHASGQNYIIGGLEKACSFECSECKVVKFVPFPNRNITFHTNHPLVNHNYNTRYLNYLSKQLKEKKIINEKEQKEKYPRFEFLKRFFKNNPRTVDIETIKSILSSRESKINNKYTFGCTIMVLSENPKLLLAPGRPDTTKFIIFKFSEKE